MPAQCFVQLSREGRGRERISGRALPALAKPGEERSASRLAPPLAADAAGLVQIRDKLDGAGLDPISARALAVLRQDLKILLQERGAAPENRAQGEPSRKKHKIDSDSKAGKLALSTWEKFLGVVELMYCSCAQRAGPDKGCPYRLVVKRKREVTSQPQLGSNRCVGLNVPCNHQARNVRWLDVWTHRLHRFRAGFSREARDRSVPNSDGICNSACGASILAASSVRWARKLAPCSWRRARCLP